MTHLSVSEERRNGVSQRGKYYKELLRSQQGELDAVLMYQRLAKVVKTDNLLLLLVIIPTIAVYKLTKE